jgi:hypothetical protein
VLDPSCSSLYVGPDIPSMHFPYLVTTTLPLPSLFLRMYLVDWQILLAVHLLGGELSANSRNTCRLPCLEDTRVLREDAQNFKCCVGATQPIGTSLPPSSCKSMQLS